MDTRVRSAAPTPCGWSEAPADESLPPLPDAHRRALGLFLRHLAMGERVAQHIAVRQAQLAPDARSARFLRSQARQERTHALAFDGFARALGTPPLELPDCPYRAYAASLHAAVDRGDFLDTVLGTQIVLEALGEMLLLRLDRSIARRGDALQRTRRRILAQEAAHHAFGEAIVAAALAAGAASRIDTRAGVQRYRRLATRLLDAGTPALVYFGVAAGDLGVELDQRLALWTDA